MRIAKFLSLPVEIISQVCAVLPRHDLTVLARVESSLKELAESKLWRHLLLVQDLPGEDSKPWPRVREVPWYDAPSQRAYKKLIRYLSKRPHVSKSVHRFTIEAADRYSVHLVKVLDIIGISLRHFEFVMYDRTGSTLKGMVDPATLWQSVQPMLSLQRLDITFPADWYDTFCFALNATPNLSELIVRPFPALSDDWSEPPIFGIYESERILPCLPFLGMLEVYGISAHSDIALGLLLESSRINKVKLVLRDYGSWKASEEFKNSIAKLGDRLEIEMELPIPNEEEKELYRLEEEEAREAASKMPMEVVENGCDWEYDQEEELRQFELEKWIEECDLELPFSPIFD